jgi:SAM-dependent methyltransferase
MVTMWDVVEHIHESRLLFAEAARVTAPGGLIAISTPNPNALSVRRRGKASVQFRDSTHVAIRALDDWTELLEEAGFSVLSSGGDAWWDPPYGLVVPDTFFKVLAQVMFAARLSWPIRSGENSVVLARRRP